MRRATPLLPALAAVLLVAGCGSEHTGSAGTGSGGSGVPAGQTPVSDPGKDGVRVVALRIPSRTAPDYAVSAAPDVSATYEVTNDSTEARTYTILFHFTDSSGGAISQTRETVRDVAPGKTVRRSVDMGPTLSGASSVTQAKVSEVTSVAADEAPADPDACPSSGIRVLADRGDAAMGLRTVGLWLENCGTRVYKIEGYPELTILDEDHERVDGVKILRGGEEIATGVEAEGPPRPLALKPGERARSVILWRNTTEFGTPVNAPYVRVVAKPGAAPVTVTPHLDLGTTGRLGVGPWKAVDEQSVPQVE